MDGRKARLRKYPDYQSEENTLAKLEAKHGETFVNGENRKFLVLPDGMKGNTDGGRQERREAGQEE